MFNKYWRLKKNSVLINWIYIYKKKQKVWQISVFFLNNPPLKFPETNNNNDIIPGRYLRLQTRRVSGVRARNAGCSVDDAQQQQRGGDELHRNNVHDGRPIKSLTGDRSIEHDRVVTTVARREKNKQNLRAGPTDCLLRGNTIFLI